jgi:hypothetical protein
VQLRGPSGDESREKEADTIDLTTGDEGTDMQLSEAQVVPLLERDLAHTLGDSHVVLVREAAHFNRGLDREDLGEKLVGDVQQIVHDTFRDSTWPACPKHPNHPLWYKDGAWWCEESNVEIARLGELTAKPRHV